MVLHKSLNLHSFYCHHVSIYLTTVWISSGANCLAIDGNTFQGGSNEKLISQESPMVCTHKHTHTQTHCLPTSEKPPGQSPSVLTRAIWDEDVPFKTFMTFLPPGLCLWAVANQDENVRQRYWAVSHGVRTWELAHLGSHLGSTGNKSYCVSSGYYYSQHVLIKSWTVCTYEGRQGPTPPGPRCLADSPPLTCCCPLHVFCSGNPGFLAVSLTYTDTPSSRLYACCCLCLESSSRLSPHFHQVCAQMSPPLAPHNFTLHIPSLHYSSW